MSGSMAMGCSKYKMLRKTLTITSSVLLLSNASIPAFASVAHENGEAPRTGSPAAPRSQTRPNWSQSSVPRHSDGYSNTMSVPGHNDVRSVILNGNPTQVRLQFASLVGNNDKLTYIKSVREALRLNQANRGPE